MTDVSTGFADNAILWAASGMSGFHGTAHGALPGLGDFDEKPVELVDVAMLAKIESLDNVGKYFSD